MLLPKYVQFNSISRLYNYLHENPKYLDRPHLVEIEYSKKNWKKHDPLDERIYQTTTIADYFDGDKHSSLVGNTKSGSEYMVNLSQYNWLVDCVRLYEEPLR